MTEVVSESTGAKRFASYLVNLSANRVNPLPEVARIPLL